MLRIPALAPEADGDGELEKMQYLESILAQFGFDEVQHYDAPDERVSSGVRPNLIATKYGRRDGPRICIVVHIDVVPPGDLAKWTHAPFEPVIEDGKLIGRGVEDNGQECVAALYGVKALTDTGTVPELPIAIVIVADEETGSKYGISYLIEQGVFNTDDLIIVPDSGNEDGTLMEVSEKSIAWLKIETQGAQCHASTPERGKNAFKAAAYLITALDRELHNHYDRHDPSFDTPISTFEPTKKEANVPNINTIPGDDVFYMDCRIHPDYDPETVLATIRAIGARIGSEHGVEVTVTPVQFERAAPPTDPTAPIVRLLDQAIRRVYAIEPFPGGIGGGTCAAIFRRAGYPAVVWSKIDDVAHSPDEFIHIDNLINDAKVYATLFAIEPSSVIETNEQTNN